MTVRLRSTDTSRNTQKVSQKKGPGSASTVSIVSMSQTRMSLLHREMFITVPLTGVCVL